jgi:hypothetical protein
MINLAAIGRYDQVAANVNFEEDARGKLSVPSI